MGALPQKITALYIGVVLRAMSAAFQNLCHDRATGLFSILTLVAGVNSPFPPGVMR